MFAYSRVKKFLASALVLTLAYPSVSLPAFAQETETAFTYVESDNTDAEQPPELLGEHTDAPTSFICGFEALPPVIVAGEPFTDLVTLRLTNTGDRVLSGAILRETGDGHPFEFADIAVQDLQPGESRSVLVDAHLPFATGEQTLTLELVDAAGTVLSPGCSVRFTIMPASNDGVCVLQNLPLEVKPGGSYPVTLRVTNTGTKTWKPTTHRIAATSPFSVSSALTQSVKPGSTTTLSWTLRVPPVEGTTPLVVGIADGNAPAFLRCMARDGASLNVDEKPEVTAAYAGYDNAECSIDSVEIDPTLPESYTAMVTLKNTGTSILQDPLEPLRGAVHIVPTDGNTTTFAPYALKNPLARGAVVVTPISFHALPGQQRLSIGLARDGASVFGSLCSVDLTVPEPIADVTSSSDESSSSELSSVESSNALSTPEETESTSSSEVTISTSSSDDVMSSSSAASSEEPSSFISSSSSLESESAAQSDALFESSSQESESSAENNTPVDSDPLPQSSSSEEPLSSINTFFTRIVGTVSAFFTNSFTAFAETLSPDQLIAAAQNEMITLQAKRDPLSARLTEVQSARDTLAETGTLERFTSAYKTDRDKLTAYDAEIATLTAQISAIDTDLAAQSVIILQNGGNPWSGTQPDLQASLTRLRTERRTIVNRINAVNRDGTGAYANSWNALVTKNPYLINGNLQRNIQGGNEVHFIVDDAAGRGDFILSPTGEALFINAVGTPTPYGMFPTTMVEDPALFFTQQSFTALKNMFDALIAAQMAYDSMIGAVETRLGSSSASSSLSSSSSSDADPSAGSGITVSASISESADPASLMVERFHQVMLEQQTILRNAKTTINTTSYLQMPPTDRLKAIDAERTRTTTMQTAMEGQLTLLEGSGAALGSPAITLAVQEAKAVLHFVQRKFEYLDRATALEQGRMTAIQTGTASDAVLRPDIKLAKSIVETYRPVPSNPDFYAVGTKTFKITSGPTAGNYLSLMPDGSIWEGSKLLGTLPTRYYEEPMLFLGVKEATPASGAVNTDPPLLTASLSMATDSMGRLSGQMSAMIDNANEDFTLVLGTDPLMNEVIATIPLNRYAGMVWNQTTIPLSLISYQKDRSTFYVRLADGEGRLLDPVMTFTNGATTTKSVWIPAALRTTRPEDAIENPSMPLAALNASILDAVDRMESAVPPNVASIPVDEAPLYSPESWMIASAVLTRLETYVAPLPQPTDDYGKRIGQNLRESDELQELMSTASDILGRVSLTENDRTRYRLALSTMQEHSDRWQRETENLQKAWSGALLGSGITPSQTDLVLFHLESVKDRYFPTTGEMEMRMLQKSVPLAGGSVRINVYRGMMEALPTLLPARHFLRSGMKSTSLRTQGSLTAIDLSMLANQAVGVHFALTVEGRRTATVRWFRGNTELATDTVKGSAVLDRTDLQGISAVIVQANPISTTAGFSVYPTLTIDDLALRSDPLWTPKNIPALSNATNRFVAMATAMVTMDRGTGRAIKNPFCTSPGGGSVKTYTINKVTYKDSSCTYYSQLSGPTDQYALVRYNAFKGNVNRVMRVHTIPYSSTYDTLAGLTIGKNERYSIQNGMSLIVYPGTPQRLAFDIAATNMSSMPQVVASASTMEELLDAPDMAVTPNRDYWTLASKSTMKTHGWAMPPSEWKSASPNYDLSDSISTFYTFKNLTGEGGPVSLNVHLGYTGTVSDAVLFSGTTTFNAGGTLGLGLQIPAMSDKPTANRRPFLTFSWTLPRGRTQVDVVQTPYVASKSKSQDPSSWSKSDQNALARAMVKVANAAALRGDTSRNYTALSTAAVNILKSNDVNNRGTMITGILNGTYAGGPRESLVAVQPVAPTASGTVLPELEKLASQEGTDLDWELLSAQGLLNGTFKVSADGNTLIYSDLTGKKLFETTMQNADDPQIASVSIVAYNGTAPSAPTILPLSTLMKRFSCPPLATTCFSSSVSYKTQLAALQKVLDASVSTIISAPEPLGDITGRPVTSLRALNKNLLKTFENGSWLPVVALRTVTFTVNAKTNFAAVLTGATTITLGASGGSSFAGGSVSITERERTSDDKSIYVLSLKNADGSSSYVSPTFKAGGALSRILEKGTYTLTLKRNSSEMGAYNLKMYTPTIDTSKVNRIEGWVGKEGGIKPTKVALFRAAFDDNGQYTNTDKSGALIKISPTLPTWVVAHGKDAGPNKSPNIKDLAQSLVARTGKDDQILVVDWEQGADEGSSFDLNDACWLSSTASWYSDAITSLNLSPAKMDYIGHSHGTHLGYLIMDNYQKQNGSVNKWNSFTALDPAKNVPILSKCRYNSSAVNFSQVSKNSWAFHSSFFGSDALTDTAKIGIKVDSPSINPIPTNAHSDAVWMFSSLVDAGGSAFFTLENLRRGTTWPYSAVPADKELWINTQYQENRRFGVSSNRAVPIELFMKPIVESGTNSKTTITELLPSIP